MSASERRWPDLWFATVAVATVALSFLVGRDGSPGWQTVRIVIALGVGAAAAYAVERGSALVRGGAAFAVGLVATGVGAGIGVPHMTKAGWSVTAVAGLLGLASGVVLLVAGAWTLIRATRRWWRLLIIPALVAVAYIVLITITVAVAATNVPATRIVGPTPGDRGLPYEEVTFGTSDGVILSGWYVPSTNGAAIVLLHGAGSTRSSVLDHAVILARNGYGVLLPDARGHGRSGGRAMDFGWYGDADVHAGVSYLVGRSDVDERRIAVVGLSMGGEEAIGAAASDDRIRAVVAEGATNRGLSDRRFLSEAYGVRGRIQQGIDALLFGLTDLLTEADPPTALRDAVAAAAPRPVLLIAAGDVPDESVAGAFVRSGAPTSVELWEVFGSGHTRALRTNPQEWERRVTEFLAAALHY
jgi:pimeloyl-ACP methyl ester carboxylesterase